MAIAEVFGNGDSAIQLGVYANLAYQIYSATNSSPQTTELFAVDRADTLWRYVRLGGFQVAGFAILGALLDRSAWPLVGAFSAALAMHLMYKQALDRGRNVPPPERSA